MPDSSDNVNARDGASIVWGPEIRVNGKRPDFVRDDDRLDWRYANSEPMTGGGEAKCFGCQLSWDGGSVRTSRFHVSHIRLPADHPHYSKAPTTPERDPALWDRMVALLRIQVEAFKNVPDSKCTASLLEARAIVADLPKPVDPDLIEARKLCANIRKDYAEGFLSGEYDTSSTEIPVAMAALRRGRELATPEVSHVG